MATADQLLSTKTQEKMNKIKKNSEDAEPKDVGGPDSTWTTAQYANFSFDATQGIKADTTIPKAVGAESMPKLKTVKEEKEDDEAESKKDDDKEDVDEEFNFEKKKDSDDDDEEKAEDEDEVKDVDEDAMIGDDVQQTDDDSLDLNLDDLKDDNTELVELADDDEEEIPVDDEPVDEPTDDDLVIPGTDDEIPADEPVADDDEVADDDDDEIPEFEISDEEPTEDEPKDDESDDDEKLDEEDEDAEVNIHVDNGGVTAHEGDVVDEEKDCDDEDDEKKDVKEAKTVKGEKMPKLKTVKEAKKPSSEKMPKIKVPKTKGLKENKVRISFKLTESKKLFEGNTVLTAEDKRQSRVLFESAVRTAAKQIGKQISETYQARFASAKLKNEAKTAKKVGQYMTYVVEQWAKDNKLALQNQLRNRLTENFLKGMKNLFVEHYIEVPTSKVNVVEALAKQVKSLKGKLHEQETKIVTLHTEMKTAVARERKSLVQEHKAKLIAEAASAVVAADRGGFVERAGTMKFANTKNFKKDLVALREQYFGTKSSAGRPARMSDAAPLFEEKKKTTKSSAMDVYLQATDKLSGQS